jgi:hypothetical protein
MLRQDANMSGIKKEQWTESQVAALPVGEHDYFDRKRGDLLTGSDMRLKCAKSLSAFANSGGGHLLLGVRDDGTFDGVEPLHGSTPTREWIEQIIPGLLSYPLEDFRVHEVFPATPSAIPSGRVIIVIDVGDSTLAPHQATPNKTYYYRQGSHSVPAPHFYLETLRNRLVRPSLDVQLTDIDVTHADKLDDGVFVEMVLKFWITNKGRVAAYKWALNVDQVSGHFDGREDDYKFSYLSFPMTRDRSSGIRLDDTLLPSLAHCEEREFGLHLRPASLSMEHLIAELRAMIPAEFELQFRVVSETSPGELRSKALVDLIDYEAFVESMFSVGLKMP